MGKQRLMNRIENAKTLAPIISDDTELVKLAQQGNQDAFGALYNKYLPTVYKRVWFSIPHQDVEDVTQEIFIAAIKSIASFRYEAQFSTWLRTITNRQIADYYRSRRWKASQSEFEIETIETNKMPALITNQENIDEIIHLRRELINLPEHYREIILLRFVDGMKFKEIAQVLGKSMEATKSLFRRAISELRTSMGES